MVERLRAVGDPLVQDEAVRTRTSTGCLAGGVYRGGGISYEIARTPTSELVQRMVASGWTHVRHFSSQV
jgi:hypothetical protein